MAHHYVNTIASAIPIALTMTRQYQDTGVDQAVLSSYSRVRYTLTVNETGDLVMRDHMIASITPFNSVQLANEGLQGICQTKALLHTKVWFPGVDAAAQEGVKRCMPCQANITRRITEPLSISLLPRGP